MKILSTITLLVVGTNAAAVVSYPERKDWNLCHNNLMNEFKQGSDGDKAACNLWSCLHDQASKYNRGGGITALSNILSPICFPIKWIPWTPRGGPPPSIEEQKEWKTCTQDLVASFDTPASGNKAACRMWTCLHDKAGKYSRGGGLTAISNILNPACGIIGSLPVKRQESEEEE